MRKLLILAVALLAACTASRPSLGTASGQSPMLVTYDSVDPTTSTCLPGYTWYNTTTSAVWVCNARTSTWARSGSMIELCKSTTAVATTGTTAETLYTCPLPAGTLSTYKAIRVVAMYESAANGNSKTPTVAFDSVRNLTSVPFTTSADTFGSIVWCSAVTSTKIACWDNQGRNTTSSGFFPFTFTANHTTTAYNILFRGTTPTAAGDLTLVYAAVFAEQ